MDVLRILFASFIEKTDIPSSSKVNSSLNSFDPNLIFIVIILLLSESMITQILIIFYYCICLNDPGAEEYGRLLHGSGGLGVLD